MGRNHRDPEIKIIGSEVRTYLLAFKISIWGNFGSWEFWEGDTRKAKIVKRFDHLLKKFSRQ